MFHGQKVTNFLTVENGYSGKILVSMHRTANLTICADVNESIVWVAGRSIEAQGNAERVVFKAGDAYLDLSLIHISEPTRPY